MVARRRAWHGRDDRGASAVEFGLVVIPLLYLLLGTIAFGYMFSFRQALSQAAAEGSRAAVGAPVTSSCTTTVAWSATNCPVQFAAASAVNSAMASYGMSCGSGWLTCDIAVGAAGTAPALASCPAGHSCVSVSVSYPYRAHSLLPSLPGYGFVLPSKLAFTSVVEVS